MIIFLEELLHLCILLCIRPELEDVPDNDGEVAKGDNKNQHNLSVDYLISESLSDTWLLQALVRLDAGVNANDKVEHKWRDQDQLPFSTVILYILVEVVIPGLNVEGLNERPLD